MGAHLKMIPHSKLNDRHLTLSLFQMSQWDLIRHFTKLLRGKKSTTTRIKTFKAKKISISTEDDRPLHVDARLFSSPPAEFTILPGALEVIYGFPDPADRSLKKRNYIFQ